MANFNEHALEMSIMQLFQDAEYTYIKGDKIHRERKEVLLTDDLKQYLYNKYAQNNITPTEVDSIILMLKNISGSLYDINKEVYKMISDGFIFTREDRTQKDIFINAFQVFWGVQRGFAIFAVGKFAPSKACMLSRSSLSGCRAEPCKPKFEIPQTKK